MNNPNPLSPSYVLIRFNRARVLVTLGRLEEALEGLEQLKQLAPRELVSNFFH
jgi:hypothetical protein